MAPSLPILLFSPRFLSLPCLSVYVRSCVLVEGRRHLQLMFHSALYLALEKASFTTLELTTSPVPC